MIHKHLRYLSYIIRHKYFVFIEAYKLGIPWLGFWHDWSKLRWSEWGPYANHFYGKEGTKTGIHTGRDKTGYYKPTDTADTAFDFAWLLHQKRNRHHWQWWVLPEDSGGVVLMKMPWRYEVEMFADWRGASRAQGSKSTVLEWYTANKDKMQLHPNTRAWIEWRLGCLDGKAQV